MNEETFAGEGPEVAIGKNMDDRIRMLLIDDDEVDRAAFRRVLNRCDLEVDLREACDAAAGIRMLEEHEFDCVILDYWLPGRDASDVLPKLIAERSQPPAVIVLTGSGSQELASAARAAGAADYLTKYELTPEVLTRSLRGALESRKPH